MLENEKLTPLSCNTWKVFKDIQMLLPYIIKGIHNLEYHLWVDCQDMLLTLLDILEQKTEN